LRMLSGESIDKLSRELGVEPYKLENWRDKALSGMEAGLKERGGDPLTQELDRAKKTIGELTMENELLRKRCEAKESLRRRRSR
jgi:transposase